MSQQLSMKSSPVYCSVSRKYPAEIIKSEEP